MNNLESVDYTVIDWGIKDNDVCISRRSSEFPRLTKKFLTHFDEKPWGIRNPQKLDFT